MRINSKFLLIFCLISLPITSLKFFPIPGIISRLIFLFAGYKALKTPIRNDISEVKIILYIIYFNLFIVSIGGLSFSSTTIDFFDSIITISSIFLATKIIALFSQKLDNKFVSIICNINIIMSLDIILQSIFGFNLIGLSSPYEDQGRFWGLLLHGTPTAGLYLVTFLFLPFFIYSRNRASLYSLIYAFAIFRSADRMALIMILIGIFLIFIPKIIKIIYSLKLSIWNLIITNLIFLAIGFTFYYTEVYADVLPDRVVVLFDLIRNFPEKFKIIADVSEVIGNDDLARQALDSDQDLAFANMFIVYFYKWSSIITKWFTFNNPFLWFGGGIATTPSILKNIVGFSRPHNLFLEIIIGFGIIPSLLLFFNIFKYVFNKNNLYYLPILSTTLIIPLANQSIGSYHMLVLYTTVICCYVTKKANRLPNSIDT
tara:strand:- start:4483 stop:5769 length:1287 start_codon:yes stop_codon:yes gene_type:complete